MNLLAEYVEHGYALVPIPKGQKGPNAKGWNNPENVIMDPRRATMIHGNVGLAHLYCTPSATAALDIDDFTSASAFLAKRGVDLQSLLDAPDSVQINSGRKNRGKLLYRLPFELDQMETCQISDPITKDMVLEFRCASSNGKTVQDVLPPSIHPETGIEYKWAGKGDWRNLPTIPKDLLKVWQDLVSANSNSKEGRSKSNTPTSSTETIALSPIDIQNLRSALLHIRADERKEWIKAGLALKSLGEIGRGLFMEWSATSRKFDPLDAADTWDTFAPTSIDYKYIFAEAQRKGWINPAKRYQSETIEVKTPEDDWPEPQKLPGELRPVMHLDPAWLPEAIREGCLDTAERLNCPLEYVVIPALISAGTALGNTVGIWPKEFDESWVVHPGLWGAIVGSPGSMKTPALLAALKPLYHLEEQAASKYKQEYAQYIIDKAKFDKDLAKYKSGKITIFPAEPHKPTKERYIVNDVTYQALGEILADNPRGVIALADELSGLLQSLDSPGQEAARGFYLSGWGGQGSYTFDRITRESVTLVRYQLSVFGGFQPDRIKAYVRFAQSGSSKNDGLLQRFQLMVWPDLPEDFVLIDRPANKNALLKLHQAIVSLADLKRKQIEGATMSATGVQLIHFDSQAQILFNKWYLTNENLLRNGCLESSEHGHFAKYRSLIPGIALLFHLLDAHKGPVCEDCLGTALQFSKYLKSHAKRIYASVHGLDSAPTRALAAKLLDKKLITGFTQRSILHKGWANLSSREKVALAVNALVEHGWLSEHIQDTGGRKTTIYKVNPGISKNYL